MTDAIGCYLNPWFGTIDPFQRPVADIFCNQEGDKVAVYEPGVAVGCYQCHEEVLDIALRESEEEGDEEDEEEEDEEDEEDD